MAIITIFIICICYIRYECDDIPCPVVTVHIPYNLMLICYSLIALCGIIKSSHLLISKINHLRYILIILEKLVRQEKSKG